MKRVYLKPDLKTTEVTINILLVFSCFLLCRDCGGDLGAGIVSEILFSTMFAAGARQGRGTTLGFPCLYVHSQEDDTSALLPPATPVHSHSDCVARLQQLRGSAWQMLLHLLLYPGTETNLLHPEFNSGFLNFGITDTFLNARLANIEK